MGLHHRRDCPADILQESAVVESGQRRRAGRDPPELPPIGLVVNQPHVRKRGQAAGKAAGQYRLAGYPLSRPSGWFGRGEQGGRDRATDWREPPEGLGDLANNVKPLSRPQVVRVGKPQDHLDRGEGADVLLKPGSVADDAAVGWKQRVDAD